MCSPLYFILFVDIREADDANSDQNRMSYSSGVMFGNKGGIQVTHTWLSSFSWSMRYENPLSPVCRYHVQYIAEPRTSHRIRETHLCHSDTSRYVTDLVCCNPQPGVWNDCLTIHVNK